MHASMPPKWTLRRWRGYLPESHESHGEVGSADGEALPLLASPGLANNNTSVVECVTDFLPHFCHLFSMWRMAMTWIEIKREKVVIQSICCIAKLYIVAILCNRRITEVCFF